MALIDINPATKHLTADLMECSIRLLDKDGNKFDYKLDQAKNFSDKERKNHPYIKNYLGELDVFEEQQIIVLNKDGSERLGPIKIPSGKLPVFRIRTRGGGKDGVSKFIVIGLVDKNSQELHFLDIHGKEAVSTNPAKGLHCNIDLMPEELERL